MWCDHCQRDVPILRQPDGGILCPQCGTYRFSAVSPDSGIPGEARDAAVSNRGFILGPDGGETPVPNALTPQDADSSSIPNRDAWWELESRLRELRFALDTLLPPGEATGREAKRKTRHDRRHADIAAMHWARPAPRGAFHQRDGHRNRRESAVVFWVSLALGLTSFVCGSILVGWSLVLKTAILGFYGVPISAVGLGFLLVAGLFHAGAESPTSQEHGQPLPHRTISRRQRARRTPVLA